MPIYRAVNKDFFKKWSSEMAYVLGYFMADGYITHSRRGASFFCFQICDLDILEKMREAMKSDHTISVRKNKRKEYAPQYRLQIGSREMCDDLNNLGVVARKTNNMELPRVPKKYFPDFVRGYFDGDGNVWSGYVHRDRHRTTLTMMTMFTSCSRQFLEALHRSLLSVGIQGGSLYKSKGNYSRLQLSSEDSLKLYDFMYNRSVGIGNLFLERKKKVFETYRNKKYAAVV